MSNWHGGVLSRGTVFLACTFYSVSALAQTTVEPCGRWNPPNVMELQSLSSWTYQADVDGLNAWNQYMPVFSTTPTDGSWGNNNESEIGGFPTSAELIAEWGSGWGGGTLAVTWVKFTANNCVIRRLVESDVYFNPSFAWTADREVALDSPSNIHYGAVLLHELGHAWGLQLQNETYDYAVPTVMHAYYSGVVQDQNVLHQTDGHEMRDNYDSVLAIPSLNNMGVHSKYPNGSGWSNATRNASSYLPGDTLDINNLLVENTGTTSMSQVNLRFYLSTDRDITDADTQIGVFIWPSFAADTWQVVDFSNLNVPLGTPAGTYWVGALISNNGTATDDLSEDDAIYLAQSVTVQASPTVAVDIDILPGQVGNWIHTNHNDVNTSPFLDDVIEVGVLGAMTSAGDPIDFVAGDIDPLTVRFGPGSGVIDPASTPNLSANIDNDGIGDASFEFLSSDAGISCGETSATLVGATTSGQAFEGTDTITTQCNASCH